MRSWLQVWLWGWSGLWNLVASGDSACQGGRSLLLNRIFRARPLSLKGKGQNCTHSPWMNWTRAGHESKTHKRTGSNKCISFHTMFTNTSGWLASKCVIVSSGTLCTFRPSRAKSWWYCDICYRDLWSREAGFRTHVITSLAFQPHPCWVSCLIKFTVWCSKSNFMIL